MKIAIIGSGISGLTAAYYLQHEHDITVYESAPVIGGHTATIDVEYQGKQYAIDTGFIVFNDWTYPNFIALLEEIGVAIQATEMSFSVRCDDSGLEYGGSNLNTLFAQRSNLLRPSFYSLLRDILRFNREAVSDLDNDRIPADITLGAYLTEKRYGNTFKFNYLLPMGCAIWSASTESMLDFPLLFFVRFFKNHGLLSVKNRPQWHVIKGGSRAYLEPITRGFHDAIECNASIASVHRGVDGVDLHMVGGSSRRYEQVVFACHSDQALKLLADPSKDEHSLLSAIPYQSNEVVLHTDESLLPDRRRAWSSWNYWLREREQQRAVLTYHMNTLQGLDSDTNFCVTLNAGDSIAAERVIQRFEYSHPVFSLQGIAAAEKIKQCNGTNRSWFAGAWLGNGFHEDGVVSGRRVATAINQLVEVKWLAR